MNPLGGMARQDDETFWSLAWAHGELTVRAIGAMLAPLHFELGGGRRLSPLYVAPWADEPGAAALGGMMRGLSGEWPCVPFGPTRAPDGLPPGWSARPPDTGFDHGYAAHHAWTLVERGATFLVLRIDLPEDDALAWMEREIRVEADAPALRVELRLQPRRDAVLPIALHPTFAVPTSGVSLLPGAFAAVHSYPVPAEPGVSHVMPNRSAASLAALPGEAGATLDLSLLPLPFATEELLQLEDNEAPFVLRYADGSEIRLDWDREHLPDVMLWISQRGRRHAPWNGRNQALGIEPCHSCFDLSRAADAPADHPLAKRRGITLRAGQMCCMSYTIRARRNAAA